MGQEEHKNDGTAFSSLLDFAVGGNNKLVLCKDGTDWMAHRMDFVNIMETEVYGFGTTVERAIMNLLKTEENEFEKNRGRRDTASGCVLRRNYG